MTPEAVEDTVNTILLLVSSSSMLELLDVLEVPWNQRRASSAKRRWHSSRRSGTRLARSRGWTFRHDRPTVDWCASAGAGFTP